MILNFFNIIRNMIFFTGSYGVNVFPETLTEKEENKYVKLMLQGDKNARNKLIEHNLRLVAHIVKKFDVKSEFTDDLISIGTIGLIKGIDSYKESKSTKITTYAARCIQNEILMYYRSNKKNQNTISINDYIGYDKDGNEMPLLEILKTDEKDLDTLLHDKDNIFLLNKYFKLLNERERLIINKRYGLNNEKEKTQKEIAKELKISRSYVSRIEKRALTKMLREFIKNNSEL